MSEGSVGEVGIVEDAVASVGVVAVGVGLIGKSGEEFAFGGVGSDFLAGALEHTSEAVVASGATESVLNGGIKEHSASAFGLDAVLIGESVGGFKIAFASEIALDFLEVGITSGLLHTSFDIGVVEIGVTNPIGVAHIVGMGPEDLVEFFGVGLVHTIHQGGERPRLLIELDQAEGYAMSVVVGVPSVVTTAAFVACGVIDQAIDGLIAGDRRCSGFSGGGTRDVAGSVGSGGIGGFCVESRDVARDTCAGSRRFKTIVEGVACLGEVFSIDRGWGVLGRRGLGRRGLGGLDGGVVGGTRRGDLRGWDGGAFVIGFHGSLL